MRYHDRKAAARGTVFLRNSRSLLHSAMCFRRQPSQTFALPPVRFLHRSQDDACPWGQGSIHTVHGFRQIYLALGLCAWMSRSFLKYLWHTSHLPGFLSESIYLLVEILCQIGL